MADCVPNPAAALDAELHCAVATLQNRLPKEMKVAGIVTVEAANRWLRESYIPEHNTRFAIAAEEEGSAFVADGMAAWRDILCVQEERTVGNDNTVKRQRLSPQLSPSRLRAHFDSRPADFRSRMVIAGVAGVRRMLFSTKWSRREAGGRCGSRGRIFDEIQSHVRPNLNEREAGERSRLIDCMRSEPPSRHFPLEPFYELL